MPTKGSPEIGLAIGEVVRHFAFDVSKFDAEVAFGFEDGAPDQRVGAALDLNACFEPDVGERHAEFGDQQRAKVRLDFVMAGPPREMPQEFEQFWILRHPPMVRAGLQHSNSVLIDLK